MPSMIGETIKKLRKEKDLRQKELADKLGCSFGSVTGWETGRKDPSARWRRKLAEFFGVTEAQLFGGVRAARRMTPYLVPVVSRAAAGINEEQIEFEVIEDEFIEFKGCKAMEITSNSMAPIAYKGQKIIFTEDDPPMEGDFVLCKLRNGPALFKTYYRNRRKSEVILSSVNVIDRHEPLVVDEHEIEWIWKVIGVRF